MITQLQGKKKNELQKKKEKSENKTQMKRDSIWSQSTEETEEEIEGRNKQQYRNQETTSTEDLKV